MFDIAIDYVGDGKYMAVSNDSCEEIATHDDVFELINNVALAFPLSKVQCSPAVHLIMALAFPMESWRHDSHFQRFGMFPAHQ